MSATAFKVSSEELEQLRALVASAGLAASDVHATGSEFHADAGPIVRIITVQGLPAEGKYSLVKAGDRGWMDELKRDLAAGLYRSAG